VHDTGVFDVAVDALAARARREVDEGLLPSCQWALALDGEVVAGETVGDAPAGDDTRYVMYSCTKAIVASAVWQLLGEGTLRLDDRVAEHIPEFGSNGKAGVTVEQVLLHTSGFPRAPIHPNRWDSREARLEAFAKWRLNWEPGSRFEYHPTSAHWVLAELLERIDGEDFRAVVRRRVIEPLGLTALRLGVPAEEATDIALPVNVGEPPTPEEWQEALGIDSFDPGEVTEDALLLFSQPSALAAGVPGGGAVSTAADLARFYQGLLHPPAGLWDPAVLADATGHVRNTFPDPTTGVPANRALSIVVAGDDGKAGMRGMGHTTSPRAFGHDGAGGQIAFADPETGISFAYFTNGLDRHHLRQWRRTAGIASRAGTAGAALRAGEGGAVAP
jgi:CubicO group peptidase (beta-lactamase class C family)